MLFGDSAPAERAVRVANARRMVESGEFDGGGVLVAREADKLVGTLVCMFTAGASGLIWPPQTAYAAPSATIEDALVRYALAWLGQRGAKLVQALLPPEEARRAAPLLRNGFGHVTQLAYLKHSLGWPFGSRQLSENLDFITFQDADPVEFEHTLLRTYEESCDCPEINGVRTVGDVLAGHRAQGYYDARHWWLAHQETAAVGILLLVQVPECHSCELAYLGVVPEARRHGIGRELVSKALGEASAMRALQLTLSVDSRNRPACNLYRSAGFVAYDRREVFLAILNKNA
jgi:ribosomal protein S18 acetylase RimI-like enzyme